MPIHQPVPESCLLTSITPEANSQCPCKGRALQLLSRSSSLCNFATDDRAQHPKQANFSTLTRKTYQFPVPLVTRVLCEKQTLFELEKNLRLTIGKPSTQALFDAIERAYRVLQLLVPPEWQTTRSLCDRYRSDRAAKASQPIPSLDSAKVLALRSRSR